MIKLKVLYLNNQEEEQFIRVLKDKFNILKISKEYRNQGTYKRVHVEIEKK
ncbi:MULTISPECIES: hypothetical protein [Clostridium]|uniref:hypothetical protein n=1 Tax=Clostridium TaxID=1485 RepID=UPI0012FDF5AD|nr:MULTISPECIES: hypothetical protein [Clostridium]